MEAEWYKAPDAKVRPGDIVQFTPIYRALPLPLLAANPSASTKKGKKYREIWGYEDGAPFPPKVAKGNQESAFLVPGILESYGVLITRGCDIDSGRVRQVAPIRPLSLIKGGGSRTAEDNQAAVIDGRHMSLHYLPPVQNALGKLFEDSFVDFRFVVTLRDDLFNTLARPLALSRPALLDIYLSWVTHTTGKEVPAEGRCPNCASVVHLLEDVDQILYPPPDY